MELSKLITDWKTNNPTKTGDNSFRQLFHDLLHQAPYFLRYSLDSERPDLFLIHPTTMSDLENEVVKECNGTILSKNTFQVVAYGMQTIQTVSALPEELEPGIRFEEAEDGTVVKVFHHVNEWMISTNRRIDAGRVRWASTKTFKTMLTEALVAAGKPGLETLDELDKDITYSFILLHPENQLVIYHPKPQLVMVSRRNRLTYEEQLPTESNESWYRLPKFLTLEEVQEHLKSDIPKPERGIIFVDPKDPLHINRAKLDYDWYKALNHLRHNLPTMNLSYLACSPEEKMRFKLAFGDGQGIFNTTDWYLGQLGMYLHCVYKDVYVKRIFQVPRLHPISPLLYRLHNVYKDVKRTTKAPFHIRGEHVQYVINSTPARKLDHLLGFLANNRFSAPFNP